MCKDRAGGWGPRAEGKTSRRLARALILLAAFGLSTAAAAQDLGDPTKPTPLAPRGSGGAGESSGPRWRLQSTLVADTRRLAVINGKTVKPGERVDGATVVDVRTDGVVLDYDGQRMEIRLLQSGVQRRGG